MNTKENILYNAGISTQLNEGVKFFKNSKRLSKLANKLERKIKKTNSKELNEIVNELKVISDKFDFLEKKFARAHTKEEKTKIKEEYKELESKNLEVIKLINKESTKKVLFTVGAVGLVIGILTLLSVGQYNASLQQSLLVQARSENFALNNLKRNAAATTDSLAQTQSIANTLSSEQSKVFGLGGLRTVNIDGNVMKVEDAAKFVNNEIGSQQEVLSNLMREIETSEGALAKTQSLAGQAEQKAVLAKAGGKATAGLLGVLTTSKLFSKIGKNNRVAKEAEKAIKDIKKYEKNNY